MIPHGSGQTKTVSVRFRPKILAKICFGLGVLAISFFGDSAETLFWPKQHISAEISCFGPKFGITYAEVAYNFLAERGIFGRNNHFRPKLPLSAEKTVLAEISVRPKFRLFRWCLFRFRCFGQKSVSFAP